MKTWNLISTSKWVAIFLALLVSGCGLGVDSDQNDYDIQRKWNQLYQDFKEVEGVYTGVYRVEKNGETYLFPAELRLHVMVDLEDRRENGRYISKPELTGQFRRLDVVQDLDTANFVTDYDPNTGEFVMVYSSIAGEPLDDVNIMGKIDQNHILDAVYRGPRGAEGVFEGQLTSKVVRGKSPEEDLRDRRQRLLKIYEKIAGTYQGVANDASGEPYWLSINIFIVDGEKLRARISRSRIGEPNGHGDREVDVHYSPVSGEVIMPMSTSRGSAPVPGNPLKFSASGYFKDGLLVLEHISGHRGDEGSFRAQRQ